MKHVMQPLWLYAACHSLGAVSWLANANNKYYVQRSGTHEFFVYVQVKGNNAPQEQKRVPLNISLVLDRSGSMRGDKIAYARKAAAFLVEQLSQDDVLSLLITITRLK